MSSPRAGTAVRGARRARVSERDPGAEASEQHHCPRLEVLPVGHRAFERPVDHADRRERVQVGERVLATEDGPRIGVYAGRLHRGGVRLEGVHERVDPGVRRSPRRAGESERWVAHRRACQVGARDPDIGIVQDGDRRDLRARPRGRRQRDDRSAWPAHLVLAVVPSDVSRMAEKQRRQLRHVEHGTATDPDNHIDLGTCRAIDALTYAPDRDIRRGLRVRAHSDACKSQRTQRPVVSGRLGDGRVCADERMTAFAENDVSELVDGSLSEDDRARQAQDGASEGAGGFAEGSTSARRDEATTDSMSTPAARIAG